MGQRVHVHVGGHGIRMGSEGSLDDLRRLEVRHGPHRPGELGGELPEGQVLAPASDQPEAEAVPEARGAAVAEHHLPVLRQGEEFGEPRLQPGDDAADAGATVARAQVAVGRIRQGRHSLVRDPRRPAAEAPVARTYPVGKDDGRFNSAVAGHFCAAGLPDCTREFPVIIIHRLPIRPPQLLAVSRAVAAITPSATVGTDCQGQGPARRRASRSSASEPASPISQRRRTSWKPRCSACQRPPRNHRYSPPRRDFPSCARPSPPRQCAIRGSKCHSTAGDRDRRRQACRLQRPAHPAGPRR